MKDAYLDFDELPICGTDTFVVSDPVPADAM